VGGAIYDRDAGRGSCALISSALAYSRVHTVPEGTADGIARLRPRSSSTPACVKENRRARRACQRWAQTRSLIVRETDRKYRVFETGTTLQFYSRRTSSGPPRER